MLPTRTSSYLGVSSVCKCLTMMMNECGFYFDVVDLAAGTTDSFLCLCLHSSRAYRNGLFAI